jgi:hypothetical protein
MSHTPQKMPGLPALVITLAVLAMARPACAADAFFDGDAQTPSPITDYFSLRVSYIHASADPELRLDPPAVPLAGTNLSGSQDLGFKSVLNDGLAELMFRLRDRNRITADFFELDQSGTRALNRSIVFGDQFFTQGDVVSSSLQWRVVGLRYTYAFIQNDRFELGAGVGLHLMDLDVRGSDPIRFASYETSVAGVLPTPALESVWRVTQKIALTARAEYLRGTLNGTFASLGDFHADVQYRIVPNLSVGAGYSLVELKLDSVTLSNPGLVGIRLRGPEAFVRVSF